MIRRGHKARALGMTFIEVLVWVGVTAFLMSAMTVAIIRVYNNNDYIFSRTMSVIAARRGMEGVENVLREASYSDIGAYPLVSISANSLTVYADYDNDDSYEKVRIYLSGTDLMRGITEATGTPPTYSGAEHSERIVEHVRNLDRGVSLFTYYDEHGVQVTDYTDILAPRYVRITILTNTGAREEHSDYMLRGSAYMRNLKNR